MITLHMFARRDTPSLAGAAVTQQITELIEAGFLGAGSRVWCNLEIPNAMWVLSDCSTFLRIVDVPTAGWVRLTHSSAVWGRTAAATTQAPHHLLNTADLPIPVQPRDLVTVALRNADARLMRAIFDGCPQPVENLTVENRPMRAIDLKPCELVPHPRLREPSEYDRHYAAVRGLDLMAATEPALHLQICENLDAFTSVIRPEDYERMRSARQRSAQASERIVDPIMQSVQELDFLEPAAADIEV